MNAATSFRRSFLATRKRVPRGVGAGLLLGCVALLPACTPVEEGSAAPLAYGTVVAEPSNFRVTVAATGVVEPVRELEVKSLAGGEITELYGDVGDRVERGTILAEIDPRDVRNALQAADADLQVARARMEITESQTTRSQELLAAGVISQQEHEGRNLEFANARSTLLKAETNMELAEQRMADVQIQAPLTGTILDRAVDRGQVISSASSNASGGTVLFTMADLDQVQVRIRINETDLALISPGLEVAVRPQAYPDRPFVGEVQKIEPQAVTELNVVAFPVLIVLDNPGTLLRPGMNVTVEVLVAEYPDAISVPATSVVQLRQVREASGIVAADLSGWTDPSTVVAAAGEGTRQAQSAAVFVQDATGRVTPREVVLAPGDGTRVRILSGLEAGDVVVSFAPPGSAPAGPGGGGGGR